MFKASDGSFDPERKVPWPNNIQDETFLNFNESNNTDLDQYNFFGFDPFSDPDEIIGFAIPNNQIESIDMSFIDDFPKTETVNNETDKLSQTSQNEVLTERSTDRTMTNGSKMKVDLSPNELSFKLFFYQIFTKRTKFPKKLVTKIHNKICSSLNLPKMSREETRSIDKYFKNYSRESNRILIYLHQHKEDILRLVPELLSLK
ncbi:hypothetical protein M9Y10_006778 [Tritrichomonas musculus]|uniref:Uncharacterized protein n=1 Tax=Tritrichomonas musculus TaxID=1915356 RepID=A0ABR2JFJ8_9EUKA